ncbi:putative diphthamide synthesis protein-domain-containing protein [Amylocystis lapponica]|nr:putative diphthamide synthesis protein-domain-containing protein [Amylocystis lapponica]
MAESAFSASGVEAIARTIHIESHPIQDRLPAHNFDDFYDVDRTVVDILKGDFRRIALQFPDELLHDSVPIFRALKSRLGPGRELYVLADTSYGSCCVDEVAAQHVDADAMVHYGHACMSQTSRLPVIYVFGKRQVDPVDCADRLLASMQESPSNSSKSVLILRYDVAYAHRIDVIADKLQAALPSSMRLLYSPVPLVSYPQKVQTPEAQDTSTDSYQPPDHPADDCVIFYVGGESLSLTNLLMTHASCEVHSYDPSTKTARLESARTNKLLMRRYAVVQHARDADVFGILVGTLGVSSYLPLISHLRSVLARAHKKSYTISVGKLNPAKLANFLEIECFVLVACPENSLVEAKEFLRPIVTPYELEVALQAEQTWTGQYVLDFDRLLAQHRSRPPANGAVDAESGQEEGDPDQPVFSLVTGKYRHAKRYGEPSATDDGDSASSAVVLRNQDNAIAKLSDSAAGQFLQNRTFRGLETRIGEDAPSVLEQGRSGVARGYADDHRS